MTVETICDSAWQYHAGDIPATLDDVASVIAEVSHSSEGYASEDIVGVFALNDGRFLYVSGGCDTTGWDCQSSASGEIRDTLEALIRECCTDDDRQRLTEESDRCFLHEDCWAHEAIAKACKAAVR